MMFSKVDSYYHIYFEGSEMVNQIQSTDPKLYIVNTFAHYVGEEIEQFKTTNECMNVFVMKNIWLPYSASSIG